jgi:hypothetical protein
MSNLRRRLTRLEELLTDRRGPVPYSGAWIEYWRNATDRILSGEEATPAECIPIEFVDLVLAEAAEEGALNTKVGTREALI